MPTRGMLIDLSRFWEILEYCAVSARPGSAQLVLAPELYAALDMPNAEVSHTSPLPDTFRLHDYKSRDLHPQNTSSVFAPFHGQEVDMENIRAEGSLPWGDGWNNLRGSLEDELAVLADNFFGIGNTGVEDMNGVWNNGSL